MFRKLAIAAVAVAALAALASTPAEARWGGGGWHGGWHGGWGWGAGAFATGLAFGALAARPYYYGGGPYYGAYGGYYGDGCYLRRRVVGYTPYGQPIVRAVRYCY